MSLGSQKLVIALKNTVPTYVMITIFTLFFLGPGSSMIGFSRFGEGFGANLLFALAFNLLYFVPQFMGIFLGLHALRSKHSKKITEKKVKWFLRIPAPMTMLATAVLIVTYFKMGFFPEGVNLQNLYIIFVIIIIMNLLFSIIMTLSIYSMIISKLKYRAE
jgi:hypothetical protein